jgi:hypothetical protein
MLKRIHPIAGLIGFLTILTFWTSTVLSELSGSVQAISAVKQAIPWGLLILAPALIVTGASGFRMAGSSSNARILAKKGRMPLIAGNGLLILIPCALYLATLASRGEFGNLFYAVQAVELVAGAVNLALMSLNIRDGLRLTGRLSV